jgi:pimeloyl-ACP methyl ester carboxylesterase
MTRARRQLDSREELFIIDGPVPGLQLFLRRLRGHPGGRTGKVVLYVHGATFPSALSIAHRLGGRSWRDALSDAGMTAWGFDFYGFGGSSRFPEMDEPADRHGPLGLAAAAVHQLESVVRFILEHEGVSALSLITHSWGSMPAGLFAAQHPTRVDRMFLFAPLARREGPRYVSRPTPPAWKLVTNEDQWARFVDDVPAGETPVLSRQDFAEWAEAYLESDAAARDRNPPAVKTPTGPLAEILQAWHGGLAWQPERVEAAVAIARGSWDGVSSA